MQRFLVGLARGDAANQLSSAIAELPVRHNTFPGEVFMELARRWPRPCRDDTRRRGRLPGLLSRHLPEVEVRGKEHPRMQYALLTPFAVQVGLGPDLLDEATYQPSTADPELVWVGWMVF